MLGSACFPRKRRQENGTESKKTTAVSKYYGFGRRTIFSTEGSFGLSSNKISRVWEIDSWKHFSGSSKMRRIKISLPKTATGSQNCFWDIIASCRKHPVFESLRIYPYPLVWPLLRPWSETMVSIPLWTQKTLEIKGFLGLERLEGH